MDRLSQVAKETLEEIEEEKRREIEEERKRGMEELQKSFVVKDVLECVHPRGGEEGVDGYFDTVLVSVKTGKEYRVVLRDVFNFGVFSYPKRVEGTEEVFKQENWAEEEQKACQWINHFGPFPYDRIRK